MHKERNQDDNVNNAEKMKNRVRDSESGSKIILSLKQRQIIFNLVIWTYRS